MFDGNAVNADEETLVGKKIGLVLREEEYYSNDGNVRTRLIVHSEFPIGKLADQKVPDVKKLPEEKTANIDVPVGSSEEIPF